MTTLLPSAQSITYPSGDGEPVAETFAHLYALLTTLEVLRQYLAGKQATVLANQFLYYAEGFPKLRVAPDVMVIFEVAPGGRDNYKVWEEGQVPSVIFEMTSKQTQERDKEFKKELYEGLGVAEYWLFDPRGEWIEERLRGYRLVSEKYEPIRDGRSEPLGLRVEIEGEVLGFYREETGEKLLMPEELAQELRRVARELEQERQARGQAEEREQQARGQADQERRAREEAERRVGRLAEYLRTQGIDPGSL